jgi:NADH-quinone oxidoreductase subunit M
VLTDLNFRCSPLEERSREGVNPVAAATRRRHRAHRQLVFGLALGLLQLLLLLFFYTDNLLVFFGTFEASVLPIFLLMGFFGKRSQKFRALGYLLFFTLLSALPLLGLLLLLYQRSGTVDYGQLLLLQQQGLLLNSEELPWAFLAFFLPFGVKMAAFPLHGWLPEAHVEASTEGSMLLSGVLLKVGLYGVLRCCLELCAGATLALAPYLLTLALVGALITSLSAYRQLDLKKVVAYSSVVHMNLSLAGLFCLSSTALSATLFLNFGHAVVSAGLFAAVGVLQDRTRSRSLLELSGLDRSMPLWSLCLLLLLLANAGLPGTVGFLGEAGLLWGCFQSFAAVGFLALPAVGLMGLRNLLLYAQLCWGVAPAFMGPLRLAPPTRSGLPQGAAAPEATLLLRHWDLTPWRDGLTLLLLTALSLGLGLWPQPLLLLLEESSLTLAALGGGS